MDRCAANVLRPRRSLHSRAGLEPGDGAPHDGATGTACCYLEQIAPKQTGLCVALTEAQFRFFERFAYTHAGIVIADFKRSMVLRRIQKRMKALGLTSVDGYCQLLTGPDGDVEIEPLINALTTNKTSFFREAHHFDHLHDVALPRLFGQKRAERNTRIRLWSAGCSTGEEVWSIAMTVHGMLPTGDGPAKNLASHAWDLKILATDIDTEVVAIAKSARYEIGDLGPISNVLKQRYFKPCAKGQGEAHEIVPELKRMVTFKQLNLHDEWPFKGPFDIVFCRNVVIYFDRAAQRQLFDRFADVLDLGGLLYCGHSESILSLSSRFRPVSRSVYERIA